MISIKIDFDIDKDFIQLFHSASQHEFTIVENGEMTLDEVRKYLLEVQRTKTMQAQERLGFLKVYDDDKLVGLSVPRTIKEKEHKVWRLPPDKEYCRMGMIFIDEAYRGKGIGKEAARLFKEKYPNILWTIDPVNIASKKVAGSIDLKHNATLYLKGMQWRHKPWSHERELEIWSN